MKVEANAKGLLAAIRFAAQATLRKTKIPVLGLCPFEVKGDMLKVSGTSLDMVCAKSVPVEADGETSFLLEPRPLVHLLTGASGSVTITRDRDLLTFVADGITMRLRNILPVEDWPRMVLGESRITESVPADLLRKALAPVAICQSKEETRYYLNGIYTHPHEGKLRMVAADGHRAAIYDADAPWPLPAMIVPTITVTALQGALAKAAGDVRCTAASRMTPGKTGRTNAAGKPLPDSPPHENHWMIYEGADWEITTKTIDGTFPDYRRIIPKPSDKISATMNAAALARLYTMDRERAVKIEPDKGIMTTKIHDGTETAAPCSGHGPEVGFNLTYLRAFASIHPTIRIESAGSGDPALVLTEDPALTWVLMPMRV